MIIGTTGVLVNGSGKVLLIQRDDTRTFAPPGGGLEAGELPTEGVVREVREETGLIVMPVRLVGVFFSRREPDSLLIMMFRCLQRGGDIETSEESLSVGFYPTHDLPRPMTRLHRERLTSVLQHKELDSFWEEQPLRWVEQAGMTVLRRVIYPYKDWQRQRHGQQPHVSAARWDVGAFVVIQNEVGAVLWVKRTDMEAWNLPGGGGEQGEAPWETAVREAYEETNLHVKLDRLGCINVYHNEAGIVFTFIATIESGQLQTGPEAAEFAWFVPGAEPKNCFPQHIERVTDAQNAEMIFRHQDSKIHLGQ
ncbi:MAG: NUDIX hydrolase [Chloroflexota bacterium]